CYPDFFRRRNVRYTVAARGEGRARAFLEKAHVDRAQLGGAPVADKSPAIAEADGAQPRSTCTKPADRNHLLRGKVEHVDGAGSAFRNPYSAAGALDGEVVERRRVANAGQGHGHRRELDARGGIRGKEKMQQQDCGHGFLCGPAPLSFGCTTGKSGAGSLRGGHAAARSSFAPAIRPPSRVPRSEEHT